MDRHELVEVLKQMGMKGTHAMVDKILATYDSDGMLCVCVLYGVVSVCLCVVRVRSSAYGT